MGLTYEQRQQLRHAVDRRRRENVSFLSVEKREFDLEVSLTRAFDVTSFKPELTPTISSHETYWTRKRMVAAAREWYRQHGRSPSRNDWAKAGAYHPAGSTVCEHLGSWLVLLDLAGLPRNTVGAPTFTGRVWTQESVVLAVQRWAERHGRPPRWGDWVRAGEDHPTYKMVKKYCGSFAAAWEMTKVAA